MTSTLKYYKPHAINIAEYWCDVPPGCCAIGSKAARALTRCGRQAGHKRLRKRELKYGARQFIPAREFRGVLASGAVFGTP